MMMHNSTLNICCKMCCRFACDFHELEAPLSSHKHSSARSLSYRMHNFHTRTHSGWTGKQWMAVSCAATHWLLFCLTLTMYRCIDVVLSFKPIRENCSFSIPIRIGICGMSSMHIYVYVLRTVRMPMEVVNWLLSRPLNPLLSFRRIFRF